MGVAVVQTAGGVGISGGTNDAFAAFPSNVTAGNYILAFGAYAGQSPNQATISDTLGQSYTLIGQVADGANVGTLQAWYVKIPVGGACTVDFTTLVSSSSVVFAYELSGVDGSLFFEGFGTDKNSGLTQSTSAPVGAPSSFTGLAVLGVASNSNGNTFTYPSPLAQRAQFGDGSFSIPMYIADGVPNTTAPINLSAHISAGAPFATIGILVKEANGVFQGCCGAGADDRYRFRPSSVVSHTSTQMHLKSAWPTDARDLARSDTANDNVSRLN